MGDKKQTGGVRTVWWEEDASQEAVCLLDQSLLPQEVIYLQVNVRAGSCRGHQDFEGAWCACHWCHRGFWYGSGTVPSATGAGEGDTLTLAEAQAHLRSTGELLAATRPTAVNLFWAIERMQLCAQQAIREQYHYPGTRPACTD